MAELPVSEKSIFHGALEKNSAAERKAYLDEACKDNPHLRAEIEALIAAHLKSDEFLEKPAAAMMTVDYPIRERPGTVIGSYKLREQIGEGGFGVVYVAEQTEPVRRKVALKIIKPGMDTREVIARFEAERQALALMDHPNIAKVFDGGATDSGRPYFVMELVKGIPITDYCDQCQLTMCERLELLFSVCQAVQHAHQKGVIHRDIKPSNVLVAMQDGKPAVKVIDFGIAKAMNQKLSEHTLLTGFHQMIGTPLYMSPEQAEMSPLDVDTRSDIYSLGVLLYELLTGTTPFEKERLSKASYDEIRRILREEEPPRPSARLSTLEGKLTTVATQRRTEPRQLLRTVRGELDWIVMKCLEKDRGRRYETANALAADVRRYLDDEPVQACPPSVGYRFRKFARRNKGWLLAASVLAVAVLVAMTGIGWAVRDREAQRAEVERQRIERQQRLTAQVDQILADVDRLMEAQKWPEALDAAQRAETALAGGEANEATRQKVHALLKDLAFIDRLEQIRMERATVVEGKFDNAGAVRKYGQAFRDYGVDVEQLPVETAIARLQAHKGIALPLTAALDDWVDARRFPAQKDAADWKRLVAVARGIDPDEWRDRLRASWGEPVAPELQAELRRLAERIDVHAQHPATLVSLARTLNRAQLADAAEELLYQAQLAYPADFWLSFDLGAQVHMRKDHEGAIRFWTAAVSIRPSSVAAHNNLGSALSHQGKLDQAIACLGKVLKLDPKNADAHNNLGGALKHQGKLDQAIACLGKAIELDPKYAAAHNNLGLILKKQGKLEEAIACYRRAIEINPKYAMAHYRLGAALWWERWQADQAIICFKKAIELNPKLAGAYNGLGSVLCDGKRDYRSAEAAFRKAIELKPTDSKLHFNLGNALRRQRRVDEAIVCYKKVTELDPKHAEAHSNLGVALQGQGNLDEAITCYRKAIKLNPKLMPAHTNLGVALQGQGKPDEAIACYEKAIELIPNHPAPRNNLAWLLVTTTEPRFRNPAKAVMHAKNAVKLAPTAGGYWNTLGVARYRNGDWKAAVTALHKSMQLRRGGDGNDWFFLAMAHWQLGDKGKARQWYDKAVQWMEKNSPANEELRRFRAEAAELLGINKNEEEGKTKG